MANPFSKGWKYLMSSFDQKIDENADPKVQIQQAVEGAKKQHQEISDQAAEIIGNRNKLEMQLNRLVKTREEYQNQTKRALELADKATAEGDSQKAQEYNDAAEVLASQLVSAENELENLQTQHAAAKQAAEQAQRQQKESSARLKEQLAQVDQLLAQADQAEMQEKNSAALNSMNELAPDGDTPTLDSVRAKIEKRYTDALGAQELYQDSAGAHMQEIAASGTDMKAAARLDEIRASLNSDKQVESGAATTAELESGEKGDADSAESTDSAKD